MPRSTNGHVHADNKNIEHAPSPIEQLIKALSDSTRLEIISILSTGSKTLDTITKELKFDKKKKPNVRKHLEELKKGNLAFQVQRGKYCLVCPELTRNILESMKKGQIELNETYSSLAEARVAYNNYIITHAEKDKFLFEMEFDRLFEKTFSQIGGELRACYIDMARNGEYDFSRLTKI